MLMPLDFLLRWLSGVLTIALLGGAGYILHQWYEGELISDRWLVLGIILLLWSGLGDEMWSFVQSKRQPRWLWQAIDPQSGKVLASV